MNNNFKIIIATAIVAVVALGIFVLQKNNNDQAASVGVNSFKECVDAGYPVQESYPERCSVPGGETFTRNIGNELEKVDLIRIDSPRPGELVEDMEGVLVVSGEARGYWYFEGDFPVEVRDESGEVIGLGIAMAQGDWMVNDFVPFEARVVLEGDHQGEVDLVLHRNNPSDLRENDDSLVVPIVIERNSVDINNSDPQDLDAEDERQLPPRDIDISDPRPLPREPVETGGCFVGGCSSQICSDDPGIVSTCEWKEEYACYRGATCERQPDGRCGWTPTEDLLSCIENSQQVMRIPIQ